MLEELEGGLSEAEKKSLLLAFEAIARDIALVGPGPELSDAKLKRSFL